MKRVLIGAVVVLVVAVGYINFSINSKLKGAVDEYALLVSPFGTLTYDSVSVSLGGTASVNRIRFQPHTEPNAFEVRRLEVSAGNLWQLYSMTQQLDDDEYPPELRIALRGVHLDMGVLDALVGDLVQGDLSGRLEAAGCGERTHFTFSDLAAMGYGTTLSDLVLEYRYDAEYRRLDFETAFSTENMNVMRWGFSFSGSESGPQAYADPMMTVLSLIDQLNEAWLELEDRGYLARIVDYCARETGMEREAFRQHHIDAWQAAWRSVRMEPGENVMTAYREFVHNPGKLRLSVGGRSAAELALLMSSTSPTAIMSTLNPRIAVNNGEPRPLDFVFDASFAMTRGSDAPANGDMSAGSRGVQTLPQTTGRSTRTDTADSRAAASGTVVALNDLNGHLGRNVRVVLVDGRHFDGSIMELQADQLQLRREMFQGSMVMPVRLETIAEVRLR